MTKLFLAVPLLASVSLPAMAQDAASSQTAVPQAATEGRGGPADIVVTAQRRGERLQDVPIAIAAISGDTLGSKGISSTNELRFAVPSLNYGASAGYALPYLRGIGTDITQPNSDPSVATYVDGVFLANVSGVDSAFLGVDRVEVLLGPQGTLYGKNAVGGAISVVTLSPTDKFEAKASVSGGNYSRIQGEGHISGPITQNLYAGIYAQGIRRDSFYKHLFPVDSRVIRGGANNTPDHESSWAVRGKLVFDNGPVKITGSIERAVTDSADSGVLQNIQPTALGVVSFGAPYVNEHFVTSNDGAAYFKTRSTMATLKGEFDLDAFRVVSITSYRDFKNNTTSDFDGTTAPIVDLQTRDFGNITKDTSQELQLQSNPGSKFTWIVGAYYFHENGGFLPTGVTTGVLFAPVFGPGVYANESFVRVKTNSYAVYAQVTAPFITEGMNLTLGARQSWDKKDLDPATNWFRPVNPDGTYGDVIPGTTTNFPARKASWNAFTPKITLDYKAGHVLYYATYSKGYKPGTWNIASPANPGPVKPEFLSSYEVGLKADFLDGKGRLNLSGYYYNFKDIQVQVNAQGVGSLAELRNGAAATAYGAEAQLTYKILPELQFDSSIALEHTKYDSFINFPGYEIGTNGNPKKNIDASGDQMVRAPKLVVTAGLHYNKELPNGGHVMASGDWYHNDGFYWEASNTLRQPKYDLFNASLGYSAPNDTWSISAWIKNIGNKRYFQTALLTDFGTVVNEGAPRTFGATATVKFD